MKLHYFITLICALISLKNVSTNQFGYTRDQFREMAKKSLAVSGVTLKFDPFCRAILEEFIDGSNQRVNSFFDFVFNDFRHEMTFFDERLSQSWDVFINLAFYSFVNVHREAAVGILNDLIMDAYPIFDNVDEVISNIFINDGPNTINIFGELVAKEFKKKWPELNNYEEYEALLLTAKKSAGGFDEAFKFHYAFLRRVQFPVVKGVDIDSIEDNFDIEILFSNLAARIYESLGLTEAKLLMARIYPAVVDDPETDFKAYGDVIDSFKKSFEDLSDTFIPMTPAKCKELIRKLPLNQKTLLSLVLSIQREHSLIRKLASKMLKYYSIPIIVSDWKQFLFYLQLKLNEFYPEEMYRYNLADNNNDDLDSFVYSMNNGWIDNLSIYYLAGERRSDLFLKAAQTGRLSLALLFASTPQKINPSTFAKTMLEASTNPDQRAFDVLLKYSINFPESLELAARCNKLKIFEYVYANGVFVDKPTALRTAFISACSKGHEDIINYITSLNPHLNKDNLLEIVIAEALDMMTI